MQAALGTGIISSAVLMSDDLDEIDWEWSGSNFGSPSGKVQTNYFGKGITGNYDRGSQPTMASPTTQFHVYVIDWSPTALTWSVDGNIIRTLLAKDCDSNEHQYPQTPARLHLGVWNAGDHDEGWNTVSWAGGYTDFTKAPYTAYVRSVKVTNTTRCSSYQYTDTSGRSQSIKCVNLPTNSSLSSSPTSFSSTTRLISLSSSSASSSLTPTTSGSTTVTLNPQASSSQTSSASPIGSSSSVMPGQLNSTTATTQLSSITVQIPTSSTTSNLGSTTPASSTTVVSTHKSGSTTIGGFVQFPTSTLPSLSSHVASTTSRTQSTGTTTSTMITSSATHSNPTVCNHDNCLNNLNDSRYIQLASTFCPLYTQSINSASTAIPSYLKGCAGNPERVSSACSCFMHPSTSSAARTFTVSTLPSG